MGHHRDARARMIASRGRSVSLVRAGVSTPVTAFLRAYAAGELMGGLEQGDARLETGILPAPFVPPIKGDQVRVDGRAWLVLGAVPVSEGETVIGYTMTIRGG